MAKKYIILTLLLLPVLTAWCQPNDCSRFRDGKFRIADTRAGAVIIADRRGGYQTESSETLKAVVRFRVTWQDNCTYTLTLDKVIRNDNKIDFPTNMTVHVNITETARNSYTQRISSSIANGAYDVEVTKLD